MFCYEKGRRVDMAYDVFDGWDEDMLVAQLPPLVVLHGLVDHKGNWTQVASTVADKTVRKVYVIDLRNHGKSPRADSMSVEETVKDAEEFLDKIGEPVVLVGHSFGGIVAMQLAFRLPHLVKELVLIDISPLRIPPFEEELGIYMEAEVNRLLSNCSKKSLIPKKTQIEKHLPEIFQDSALCHILLSNLTEEDNEIKWKANVKVLKEDVCHKKLLRNLFPLRGHFNKNTLLIHGSSEYVRPSDYPALRIIFPKMEVVHLKGCGHWIHVDKADELVEAIVQFLGTKTSD